MIKTLCTAGMLLVSACALAQSGSGLRTPLQKDFWGYAGLSGGESRFRNACPGGLSCGNGDTAWRLYGGGSLRSGVGFEVGYLDLGNLASGGGEADARGVNFSLLLGLPIGQNSGLHAKLGTVYGVTHTSGGAPGLAAGRESGWHASYGVGASLGLSAHWQARLDWDRNRFEFAGGERDVDTTSVGLQYRF